MINKKIVFSVFFTAFTLLIVGLLWFFVFNTLVYKQSIKIGLLYSLSGPLSFNEKPAVDGILLAIKEINQSGGVEGKTLEPILVDGASDPHIFAQKAEELIIKEKVAVIFGCKNVLEYNAVKPIIEKHDHFFVYTGPGNIDYSPTTLCVGLTPNQQIIPTLSWCLKNLGNSFFLVGSNTFFSHITNTITTNLVTAYDGKIVGQEYVSLDSNNVTAIAQKIRNQQPDIIINTIAGNGNIAFYKALRDAGIRPENIATISFCIAETEIHAIGIENMIGDYAAWGYFQTIPWQVNQTFVAALKTTYGNNQLASDAIESAYFAVHLWKNSVTAAQTVDPKQVKKHLSLQAFYAPEGMIYTDQSHNYTWRLSRIGKVQKNGQFFIIWESEKAISPQPYSLYLSKEDVQSINVQLSKDMQ